MHHPTRSQPKASAFMARHQNVTHPRTEAVERIFTQCHHFKEICKPAAALDPPINEENILRLMKLVAQLPEARPEINQSLRNIYKELQLHFEGEEVGAKTSPNSEGPSPKRSSVKTFDFRYNLVESSKGGETDKGTEDKKLNIPFKFGGATSASASQEKTATTSTDIGHTFQSTPLMKQSLLYRRRVGPGADIWDKSRSAKTELSLIPPRGPTIIPTRPGLLQIGPPQRPPTPPTPSQATGGLPTPSSSPSHHFNRLAKRRRDDEEDVLEDSLGASGEASRSRKLTKY